MLNRLGPVAISPQYRGPSQIVPSAEDKGIPIMIMIPEPAHYRAFMHLTFWQMPFAASTRLESARSVPWHFRPASGATKCAQTGSFPPVRSRFPRFTRVRARFAPKFSHFFSLTKPPSLHEDTGKSSSTRSRFFPAPLFHSFVFTSQRSHQSEARPLPELTGF